MNYEEALNALEPLKKNKKVAAVYIFGSYLKSKKKARDIDICIISRDLTLNQMAKISQNFEKPIDLSFIERMPDYISIRVLKYGKPIFVNNSHLLSQIWLSVVRNYLRYQPMRLRIYSGVRKWMSSTKLQTV